MTYDSWKTTEQFDTEPVEGAWDRLETPPDWREEEFVPREGDGSIPLWVTLLVACGLWGVGYYLVVLGLYVWGLI